MFEERLEAALELTRPIYHIPTQLGIGEFKRLVNERFAGNSKSFRNRLIKAYKKRAWMEFEGVSRGRGAAPVRPAYGKKLAIDFSPLEVHEVDVVNKTMKSEE